MIKLLKILLIIAALIWIPLLVRAEPLTIQAAYSTIAESPPVYTTMAAIITLQCDYSPSKCGFNPAIYPPPEKPRKK